MSDRLSDLANFGGNPGELRARYYIPSDLLPNAPLVVVLHGCTQSAAVYDHGSGWSAVADANGFALLFPEQTRGNNSNLCFNWFVREDITRGHGEAESIRRMILAMTGEHGLDPARVFVTGLSAGGAMTSVMLATYPELFAGGAIIAGLPYGTATTLGQALERMRGGGGRTAEALAALVRAASPHGGPWPTVSVWHGSADQTVDATNAAAIVDQWRGVRGLPAAPSESDVVHGYPHRVWRDAEGRAVIEDYTITGMGHGTPLAAAQVGAPAAHMLETGISSTLRIAQFWGIAGKSETTRTAKPAAEEPAEANPTKAVARLKAIPLVGKIIPKPAAAEPSGVQEIIEKALRTAGLMK